MITLTPKAAEQVRLAAEQNSMTDTALRIAVRQATDGSLEYGMGFDQEGDNDVEVVSEGVRMLIYAAQEAILLGLVVDYDEYMPGEYGFVFMNPNDPGAGGGDSGGSCGGGGCSGCGSSTQGCD